MDLPVPGNKQKWESEARLNNVPITQLLSDCSALPSGSKFTMEHYLPLRILLIDERSLSEKNRRKLRERYVRADIRRKVVTTMKGDQSLQAVRKFLTRTSHIQQRWNADHYRSVGPFGNGLEKLYQIVSRKSPSGEESEDHEDNTNSKIFASGLSPPSVSRLNETFQSLNINPNPATPPPRSHLTRSQPTADYRDVDEDDQLPETPGTQVSSAPGTDKRLAIKDFERTTLVLSDEQTVNTCLENLLMAFSNVMGFYGRLLSDRRAFVVPKDESSNLYQACVDGLVMTANRQDIMAFIEVKRRLRSTNDSIYRQIGAQMAAFIRNRDHQQSTQR